ncbi:hypothetical protein SAMN02910298_00974 [Pseudobutyrivibrio sp. YE44]|uniref:hypothetical protein n=1 Tax=Pseudobutyrivibrio sp. YE44 TaxID=1520802 RepID=UPI000888BBD5|nr:hypothetical protein [Pseudobutyrivibrio sp. YE44]SDB20649.1 hypothetical protein SAMN02910298_00974 [Pseudobutyrivibrio sp. YE44]
MDKQLISIDADIFDEITKGLGVQGALCSLNKEILDYKRNTTESNIGSLLYSYLEELCDCSQLHMEHISEPLPKAN